MKETNTAPTVTITSPRMQRYIAGAISWHDYQVLINKLNRSVKFLSVVPEDEQLAAYQVRRQRGKKYKKALRIHQEHVRLGTEGQIAEAEQTL
jgi:hypothetical protein